MVTEKILIVEDEADVADLLAHHLKAAGFSVEIANNGHTALNAVKNLSPTLVVLDLMLPVIDGFEIARRLRRNAIETPILMLTARDAVPDIVKGLDVGADDYLTKPFAFEVFLARLRSVARRGSTPRPTILQVGDLVLNPASHQVTRGEREIHLSPTEFRLLELLMRRAGRVVRRDTIVDAVWDFDHDVEENTLDTFIRLLRSKIDRERDHKLIQTVRGVGYMIRENPRT